MKQGDPVTYHDEARKRLDALPLDADDNTMAAAAADVLLSAHPLPYRIAIDHRVAVLIKDAPERLKEGACLLSYDWRHTNILGIDVMNRDFADRWIRDALCFGYSVSRLFMPDYGGYGLPHMKKPLYTYGGSGYLYSRVRYILD